MQLLISRKEEMKILFLVLIALYIYHLKLQHQQNITIRTTTTIGLLLVSAVLRVPHR